MNRSRGRNKTGGRNSSYEVLEPLEQSDDSSYAISDKAAAVAATGHVTSKSNSAVGHPVDNDGRLAATDEGKGSRICSDDDDRCRNGGICSFDAKLSTDRCFCQLGFGGRFCETGWHKAGLSATGVLQSEGYYY